MANIKLNEWTKYRDILAQLNQKAADEFRDYFFGKYGAKMGMGLKDVSSEEAVNIAYAIVNKYGEASSEVACQMYEKIAKISGRRIASAVPAELPEYSEVAKAINGSLKKSATGQLLESTVQRMVKQVGQDTILRNARRDGAEFAWMPDGANTCAFCIILASRGWQRASRATMNGDHADHIHANCACTFAIRFDDSTEYDGYNPSKYEEMYSDADGTKSKDKLNSLRREQYAEDKEKINKQKREAYAIRNGEEEPE